MLLLVNQILAYQIYFYIFMSKRLQKFSLLFLLLAISSNDIGSVYLDETFNYTVGDINAQGSWTTAGTTKLATLIRMNGDRLLGLPAPLGH